MTELNPVIGSRRLENQRISTARCTVPEDVVRWMGALQAQDYGQAVWAVALRTQGATLADVERAIAAGKIICTWPMRGTIHFIPPENARWMLELFAARVVKGSVRRLTQLDLTEADIARCQEIGVAALSGGGRLTRPQLLGVWEEAGISTAKQRGYALLTQLAQRGVICQGPRDGRQQTFVLLDEWAPGANDLSRTDALAQLARGYFASHGPATVYDLAWWVGSTLGDARLGIAGAQDDLRCETIDGQDYFTAVDSEPTVEEPSVHLLPGFDEYLLGYKDRGAVLAEGDMDRIVPGNNGMFLPMMVVDGQVIGTWTRAVKKTRVNVTLRPFTALSAAQMAAATAQAERYAAFHGLPLALQTQ